MRAYPAKPPREGVCVASGERVTHRADGAVRGRTAAQLQPARGPRAPGAHRARRAPGAAPCARLSALRLPTIHFTKLQANRHLSQHATRTHTVIVSRNTLYRLWSRRHRRSTYKTLADLALVEPALAAAEGDVVHLLVAAVEASLAVRAARRRRQARQRRALQLAMPYRWLVIKRNLKISCPEYSCRVYTDTF